MRTPVALVLTALFVLTSTVSHAATDTIDLLQGDDLDHWYTWLKDRGRDEDPKGVFSKTDGILRLSGEENGHLITNEEYGDYHLLVEFKWGDMTFAPRIDKARDSGIIIHSVGKDDDIDGTWMHGLIVNLFEGGTGTFYVLGDGTDAFSLTSPVATEKQNGANVFSPDGELTTLTKGGVKWFGHAAVTKDVKGFRGEKDVENPIGEWNRLEVIADGGKITVLLNGIVVNRAMDCNPKKGRIQLQTEGAEIFFRTFDLTPLDHSNYAVKDSGRQKRFIYNTDGGNIFIEKPYPMTPEDVYSYVDEVADKGITSFHVSSHVGMDMNFQGETADLFASHLTPEEAETLKDRAATKAISTLGRGAANILGLHDAGHDPLGIIIARAQEKGLETFVSFRLNEVHWVEKPANMLLSKFWLEHPEWRVAKMDAEIPQIYLDILGPRTSRGGLVVARRTQFRHPRSPRAQAGAAPRDL